MDNFRAAFRGADNLHHACFGEAPENTARNEQHHTYEQDEKVYDENRASCAGKRKTAQTFCLSQRSAGSGKIQQAAFEKVLDIAKKNNVSQEEMPKAIVVISDMEIDYSGNKDWTFYDKMEKKFRKSGYVIPNIIFWNVDSRHDIFHADATRKGVQLASGQSVTVFKQVLQNLGYNPIEAMENIINSERYNCITIEKI